MYYIHDNINRIYHVSLNGGGHDPVLSCSFLNNASRFDDYFQYLYRI